MIEIIEHKDYTKAVDNDTVVEVAEASTGIKKKLFKVFDGIWLDPTPIITTEQYKSKAFILPPYQKNYCHTIGQKSKYLEQMTIVFKRINSVPLGKTLLEDLSKGSPVNFSTAKTWTKDNMITPSVNDNSINRKFRATCIIKPNTGYLENAAITQSLFKAGNINTVKLFMYFHPDCIYSLKKDTIIHYIAPDVVLYHELLHIVHSIYNILGVSILEEEYITFGHLDALNYLNPKLEYYKNASDILLENLNLIKIHINSTIRDYIDKEYFQEKYGFTNNTVVDNKFVYKYINKYQFTHSEYNYMQQLNLSQTYKKSYKDPLFLAFNFDISDTTVFTLEKGFVKPSTTMAEIKANPLNILVDMGSRKLSNFLKNVL